MYSPDYAARASVSCHMSIWIVNGWPCMLLPRSYASTNGGTVVVPLVPGTVKVYVAAVYELAMFRP